VVETDSANNGSGETPTVALSVDGRIAEDKICIECGYNLRGLLPGRMCPECGAPISASLRGHELQHASLPWLRKVTFGFELLRWGIITLIFPFVAALLGRNLLATSTGLPPWAVSLCALVPILMLVNCIGLVVVGLACATRVEPRLSRREGWSARRLTRLLIATLIVATTLFEGLKLALPMGEVLDRLVVWFPVLQRALVLLTAVVFMWFVVGLLRRTAEEKVIRSAEETRAALLIGIAVLAIAWLLDLLARILPPGTALADRIREATDTADSLRTYMVGIFLAGLLVVICQLASLLARTVALAEVQARRPDVDASRI